MIDSKWFTTDYDYSGPAEVIFEDPRAEFFGHATVGPDDYGRPIVEVTVERSIPPISDGFDLAEIQLGSHTQPDGVKVITLGGGAWNRALVTVRGKNGVFDSSPGWECRFSVMPSDKPLTLRLNPIKSEYTANISGHERLLVLPLSGFVSELPYHSQLIHGHPLQVQCPDSSVARCIRFQVNGEMAFIQQLPGVAEGSVGVKPWSGETVLTAVAVVPIADSAMADPWGWFLNVFLGLLDFASGNKVGIPWLEVRDEKGSLVRKLHLAINQGQPSLDGYGAIRNGIHVDYSACGIISGILGPPSSTNRQIHVRFPTGN
jgi:hypothetical protein